MSNSSSDKSSMLTLTRRRGEAIYIGHGEGILVTVVEIHGDKVRLGVDANKTVEFVRQNQPEKIE